MSNEMLAESTKVLRYPRFQTLYGLSDADLLDYTQFLQSISHLVALDPQYRAPLRDPNDLIVLQTAERGEADDGSEYYYHWLAALEKLVTAKGLTDVAALFERREAWADAYRHTPHGKPVQLRPGFRINYTYRHSPLLTVTRADGVAKQIRVQDGHLFICNGCCCGRTDKGFPALPLEDFKTQWKKRGIRRRLHLTISGCLGPCPLANVVLLQFRGHSMWFHSINRDDDVNLIYDYVEQMLLAETVLDPPGDLASRQFERYFSSNSFA